MSITSDMTASTTPEPLSASAIVEELRMTRISHLVVVPDTYQAAFLSKVSTTSIRMIFACTEDEAIGINAGLFATGHRPALSIQNGGFYACLNTVRGIALDGKVPTVMFIGQYGQEVNIPPEASPLRMVNRLEPTLDTWNIPYGRVMMQLGTLVTIANTRASNLTLIVMNKTSM